MPSSSNASAGPQPPQAQPQAPSFPLVGIGASAGGLQALQLFLGGVPPASGMAFVIVQHRDPTHDGQLVEILQRSTPMPVLQAADQMLVQPDHVYVIPPDQDLSLLQGRLLLLEPMRQHGPRLPIDFFFRALAADMRARSIGVILSGTGSDGTLGLRAIREASGSVFVQDPITAAFDSMPRSAIAAGLADVVASPQELAQRVLSYRTFEPWQAKMAPEAGGGDEPDLDKVIAVLRLQTGQDFSLYKKSTVYRRVERRMALHQLPRLGDYLRFLRQNKQEASQLFKELLIGVTRFFREAEVWEQLKSDCIPALLAAMPGGGTLRAWIPACSTGEEAYTLAMVFREALDQCKPDVHYALQIFATDLDPDAIQLARTGVYPANISADVSEARLQRFFVQEDGVFRVGRDIRGMVVFSQQNVVMDPPFTNIDLLSCRNLLIYLESDLQRKLLPLFHYSLRANGILVLGNSETVGENSSLFSALPGRTRLYQRRNVATSYDPADFPPVFSRPRPGVGAAASEEPSTPQKAPELHQLTQALLLQSFAPSAVLTNARGEIVYLCGKAGMYLEPAAGKASMSLFSMAREGLSAVLNEIFPKAVREQKPIGRQAVQVAGRAGTQWVDVTVQPLLAPPTLSGMVLVVFADAAAPSARVPQPAVQDDRLSTLASEMQHVRDELRTTRDEMQASQEELKSSNEELQSTNEELQSANEELTTSKEEMQSMNEELQSLNRELTFKVGEMSQSSDDMKNLLNSTDIATLFLDDQMHVRRFTTQACGIFKLIASDVGRPITDLVTALNYADLARDAQEVLRTLVFKEVAVEGAGQRWFNVRIMPYRTQDNRIDGVVITFVDISTLKALEGTLQQALEALQAPGQPSDSRLLRAQTLLASASGGHARTFAPLPQGT
ncbi:chemotaxis protein CheB [Rhodoferax lacus]|uniref:chemotaxis protein CheB n=1 Tax=Rhodoferax lacus TaxID=2184758 RepID=UPI001F1CF89A|nr:chemotaxis protein CheB [Rhodoferax lacus]